MVIRLAVDGGVAVVTLNRPDARNALNSEFMRALRDTMAEADERNDVAAIVLAGATPPSAPGST